MAYKFTYKIKIISLIKKLFTRLCDAGDAQFASDARQLSSDANRHRPEAQEINYKLVKTNL
jgi:hypothetical protein